MKLNSLWPLPVGARVMAASPVAVTVSYEGSVKMRWFGVQTDFSQSAEWNRARNAEACEIRDRILAAISAGKIVLGQPITEDSIS